VVEQKARIQELKRQLSQMQYAKLALPPESRDSQDGRQEVHVPVSRVPEVQTEHVRLMREFKVQEALFSVFTQQYEQAKIQEAKDTPSVQILDRAVPAELKSKPKTVLSAGIAGLTSLFVGVFLALFLEFVQRVRSHDKALAA
jgi:uncharacterized protein involved in exopolysaccharide biosynthesis